MVFNQIVFGDVPREAYERALQDIPDTPHWRKVFAKLQKMRVVRS